MTDHDHSRAIASPAPDEPECPCYVAGWEFGFKAGESAAREDAQDLGDEPDDGPRLN